LKSKNEVDLEEIIDRAVERALTKRFGPHQPKADNSAVEAEQLAAVATIVQPSPYASASPQARAEIDELLWRAEQGDGAVQNDVSHVAVRLGPDERSALHAEIHRRLADARAG
jgi:hypothetical protein